ncbi:MAG: MBL fold metallo-hydrolase [Acidobacteriota bacterium]|nr:MAG: MBL fold metallo-hydrolase [Acidobacteriota bacterium]
MIRPVISGAAFVEAVAAARLESDSLDLWWLGQSGFLVQWKGRTVLFDPYLSDSLTLKYAKTDKPHVRMTELLVEPEKLDFIDVVTSSHNHTDHLDRETLVPLMRSNPGMNLVIPEANREFVVERLGCAADFPLGLSDDQSIEIHGLTVHGVPAAHETVDRDAEGRCRYLGYVVEMGPWTIYHSGDTVLYDDMVQTLEPFKVDVALLPINGTRPERRVSGNLDGREAAKLAFDIKAGTVIPCHFEMFEFNTESPETFRRECERLGQTYRVLRCGERCSIPVEAPTR